MEGDFNREDFRYIDAHVHFFPERLFHAIWSYWKRVYVPLFPNWHNIYEWPNGDLKQFLQAQKIEYYTTLNYAHKKGIAEDLNAWTYSFCKDNPSAIPFGSAHPDDENFLEYSEKALTEFLFKGLKFQLLVTDFYIYDNRLDPLFRLLHKLDKILILHAGTAPGVSRQTFPGARVGVDHFKKYLDKFPENKVVIAHMGGYEYEAFFQIVEQYPNVYLDTAMVFPPKEARLFVEEDSPGSIVGENRLLSFMEQNSRKILFGSDFPNIPYDYKTSIDAFLKLNLSREAFENIFFLNAQRLFKLIV